MNYIYNTTMAHNTEHTEQINPKTQLTKLLRHYLPNTKTDERNTYPEFEIRFGTRGAKISKIEYDNVIQTLMARGFKEASRIDRLDIHTQFQSDKQGARESSIRVELHGAQLIQEYCRTNKLDATIVEANSKNKRIKFVQKMPIMDDAGNRLDDAWFSDFNFTVSYKNEKHHYFKTNIVAGLVENWANLKKSFRMISRVQFKSFDSKLMVDMSIVRTSTLDTTGRRPVPIYYYNIGESRVFDNQVSYEIEAEFANAYVTVHDTVETLTNAVHNVSKIILCGLQNSNYPISMSEKTMVLSDYSELVYHKKFPRLYSSNFIGPSSITLQQHNIVPYKQEIKEPNIRHGYAVTDKADGERHLLFINSNGGIYLINTSMDVVSTGTHTKNEQHFNTIMDGELIKTDRTGAFINRFAAFDLYFLGGKNVREQPLITDDPKARGRLKLLTLMASAIIQEPNAGVGASYVSISVKTFIHTADIFEDCLNILRQTLEYDYFVDGLILTPIALGVGSDVVGKAGPMRQTTWKHSFKWKPSSVNTNDFLVYTKKDDANNDVITSNFVKQVAVFHKTLILNCGYSEKDHGYANPMLNVINKIRDKETEEVEVHDDDSGAREKRGSAFKPEQFIPSDPVNISAGLCYITIDGESQRMLTADNEIIEDKSIVEFRFDKDKYDKGELVQNCWIPIKNRYDKTAKYRRGEKMFGNAYHTANTNWHSIHYPVTENMLCGIDPVPDIEVSADVYYNNTSKKSHTEGLRNFHNMFVKKMLIWSVAKPGDTLIDYGCGKGGDIPKWITRDLSFVLGLDYSADNIDNRFDGAYARYITHSRRHSKMPSALFVIGDCSKNIRSGDATESDINKEIIKSVFGKGEKAQFDEHTGIHDAFGVGTTGFNVSSCQFAFHYFCKNESTFHGFLRNVCECTAVNGYFIGTCYDGHTILDALDKYRYDHGINIYESHELLCEIIKKYDTEDFEDDSSSCLGKKILVYQDSINQYLPEYLVNFRYLVRIIGMYGFELLQSTECRQLKLPASEGMFNTLFRHMENSPAAEYGDALRMTDSEKRVSFLNRYFVFKKVRDVNAETVMNAFVRPTEPDKTIMEEEEKVAETDYGEVMPLHRKIVLASTLEGNEDVSPIIAKKITDKKPRTKKAVAFAAVAVVEEDDVLINKPNKTTKRANKEKQEKQKQEKQKKPDSPDSQDPGVEETAIQMMTPKRKYVKKAVKEVPIDVSEINK